MHVLIVGSGKGSWTMRGLQLGAAIGARVTSTPSPADWQWADVVVLVKRAALNAAYTEEVRRRGVPLVWDAVDFWSQPAQNRVDDTSALAVLASALRVVRPSLFIGATEAMAAAGGGVCVPHHSREGLRPTQAWRDASCVAYEGNAIYLGRWHDWISEACRARGWSFVVNPTDLSQADIIVALRDGPWDGWICREWKSGVKAVNAVAAGRPLISQPAAAVREIGPCVSVIEHRGDLEAALDCWAPLTARQAVVTASERLAPAFRLDAIAAQYLALLASLRREVVAC